MSPFDAACAGNCMDLMRPTDRVQLTAAPQIVAPVRRHCDRLASDELLSRPSASPPPADSETNLYVPRSACAHEPLHASRTGAASPAARQAACCTRTCSSTGTAEGRRTVCYVRCPSALPDRIRPRLAVASRHEDF